MNQWGHSTLMERVQWALDEVRPMMQKDGGDAKLVDITPDGVVNLQLLGACGKCPLSFMTLSRGIETRIRERVPEVKKVVSVEDIGCSHSGENKDGVQKKHGFLQILGIRRKGSPADG